MGEHVPGLPLRRPVAPVLVLVRAEPALDADLLAAGRDPRLPARLRRPVRDPAADPLRLRASRGPLGRRALAARHVDRAGRGARAGARDRAALGARRAEPARPRALRGRDHALGRLGSRPRPDRRARRGHRHRCVGDPVRAGDPAARRTSARLPADAAVDHSPPEPAADAAERRLYAAVPRAQLAVRSGVYWSREALVGVHAALGDAPFDPAARRVAAAAPGPRPRAAREAPPAVPDGLQADPLLERVVSGPAAAERRARHRRASPRCATARS